VGTKERENARLAKANTDPVRREHLAILRFGLAGAGFCSFSRANRGRYLDLACGVKFRTQAPVLSSAPPSWPCTAVVTTVDRSRKRFSTTTPGGFFLQGTRAPV